MAGGIGRSSDVFDVQGCTPVYGATLMIWLPTAYKYLLGGTPLCALSLPDIPLQVPQRPVMSLGGGWKVKVGEWRLGAVPKRN